MTAEPPDKRLAPSLVLFYQSFIHIRDSFRDVRDILTFSTNRGPRPSRCAFDTVTS